MLRVERVFDATEVNQIMNDPSVRPWIGGDGKSYCDATRFTSNEDCWVFLCSNDTGPGACFIFIPHTPHLYDCHTQALPHFRGRDCIRAAKICIDEVFRKTEAVKLYGRTPENNKRANSFNRMLGFKKEGYLTGSAVSNGTIINENIWGLSWREQ